MSRGLWPGLLLDLLWRPELRCNTISRGMCDGVMGWHWAALRVSKSHSGSVAVDLLTYWMDGGDSSLPYILLDGK